jgi:hypothetical protein
LQGEQDLIDTEFKSALLEMCIATWAWKDGAGAAEAAGSANEGEFREALFPLAMETWVNEDPSAATSWYFSDENAAIRQSELSSAGVEFAKKSFAWQLKAAPAEALENLGKLSDEAELFGAAESLPAPAERGHEFNSSFNVQLDRLLRRDTPLGKVYEFRQQDVQKWETLSDSEIVEQLRQEVNFSE